MDDAVEQYFKNLQSQGKDPKTIRAYKVAVEEFRKSCTKKFLNEIGRRSRPRAEARRIGTAVHPVPALRLVASKGRQVVLHLRARVTRSIREVYAQPASTSGLRPSASRAVDGRRTRSGMRLREKWETVK